MVCYYRTKCNSPINIFWSPSPIQAAWDELAKPVLKLAPSPSSIHLVRYGNCFVAIPFCLVLFVHRSRRSWSPPYSCGVLLSCFEIGIKTINHTVYSGTQDVDGQTAIQATATKSNTRRFAGVRM